ncbi:MAG: serine hydrolase [Acidimicrobiia bacterium]|nr:serine hydrolase [Acidimicrobiia bacterium]
MDDLTDLIADWPVDNAAVGVVNADGVLGLGGDGDLQLRTASVSKLFVGLAALIALEEGTIKLDENAGPNGSTVRHLLSHTAGYGFDTDDLSAEPGKRRIYSNVGIEVSASHLADKAAMPFEEYLRLAVLEPLGLSATALQGSPAHDIHSTVNDLVIFARELLSPTLVAPATMEEATTVQFPGLRGTVPGIGSFDPNPWGLTFEIRDDKNPHWTGEKNHPDTFGHFGGSGSFLWVDPQAGIAAASLSDRGFSDWALEVWPRFSDEVLARYSR